MKRLDTTTLLYVRGPLHGSIEDAPTYFVHVEEQEPPREHIYGRTRFTVNGKVLTVMLLQDGNVATPMDVIDALLIALAPRIQWEDQP